MRLSELADAFERLESTSSRTRMYEILGELLTRAGDDELRPLAYLLEAQLLPPFEGLETGMGDKSVAASIAAAARADVDETLRELKKLGDLGLVAERHTPASRRATLGLVDVYEALVAIAKFSGSGSSERKQTALTALLTKATPREARYIVRLTVGRLRLSVGSPTIIEAIARTLQDPRGPREIVERAFNLTSDLGLVLETLRARGLSALGRIKVRAGNPVRPMLAERLKDAEEVHARLGACFVEEKLDGLRFQVHVTGRGVEIFSRNLERTTGAFPDIARAIRTHFTARSAIIDGEALAINDETGEYHPFQVTVQRKRKSRVEAMAEEFPLVLVAFDLIYVDGKDLTARPFTERRAELEGRIVPGGRIVLSSGVAAEGASEVGAFFDDVAARGLEGIIAKRTDAPYTPGARNYNWVKLKRNYRGELSDTVDVVLVGYLRGRGARAKLGIGSLFGAVYNAGSDTFETVAKIGSGLSEKGWKELRELLDRDAAEKRPARVDARLEADVWVEPRHVVTVLADEITRSPIHTAARDENGRGLALRFPRIVGDAPRPDKSPEDATSTLEISEMFAMQRSRKTT